MPCGTAPGGPARWGTLVKPSAASSEVAANTTTATPTGYQRRAANGRHVTAAASTGRRRSGRATGAATALARNQDVTWKGGKNPTPERAEAIHREFHHEGMTLQEILQLGWQMTGIPDAISCSNDPSWFGCVGHRAVPQGREGARGAGEFVEVGTRRAFRGCDRRRCQGSRRVVDLAQAACTAPHRFTGDTQVLMADGTTRPIAEIKVGDVQLPRDSGHAASGSSLLEAPRTTQPPIGSRPAHPPPERSEPTPRLTSALRTPGERGGQLEDLRHVRGARPGVLICGVDRLSTDHGQPLPR